MDKQGLVARVMSAIAIEQVVWNPMSAQGLAIPPKRARLVVFAMARAIPSSPRTPPPLCVVRRSGPNWCSKARRWTAFILPTLTGPYGHALHEAEL